MWTYLYDFFHALDDRSMIRLFWFVLFIEFPRYVLGDLIGVVFSRLQRWLTRNEWKAARERLFTENPLITVLVPGKNEGKHIYALVKSLAAQTYRNYELIIVDDGSDDNTPLICRDLQKNGLINLYLRNPERGGKASAANFGLRYAKGQYVVHLDADSSLAPDAVEKILLPFFRYENVGGVGGNVKVRNSGTNLCTSLQALEYLNSVHVGRIVLSWLGIYKIISGAFGAFPTALLRRIGGWDIGPGLDGDITIRIRKLGFRIIFEEEAVCLTNVPETWKGLTKQRLRWNKSIIRFRLRKHRDVFFPGRNFSMLNFLAFVENIYFNVIADFIWVVYVIGLILFNFTALVFVLPIKLVMYFIMNLMQFMIALAISKQKKKDLPLLLYVPALTVYVGYYMRIVRTVAYIRELLFYSSYKDPWNPAKTSRKALEYGL
ncbi:glycosyltransferase family 2 protein [Chitinophaga flava]|uniref:glycosyltransferase family 2 protein n=1 Tax=Chitinophaga flava TaxID=2259036 RepID=UPI001B867E4C|nr:glycosyltransferase [Chitinophaga flava]